MMEGILFLEVPYQGGEVLIDRMIFRIISNNIIRSYRYSVTKFLRKFVRCSQMHKMFSCC